MKFTSATLCSPCDQAHRKPTLTNSPSWRRTEVADQWAAEGVGAWLHHVLCSVLEKYLLTQIILKAHTNTTFTYRWQNKETLTITHRPTRMTMLVLMQSKSFLKCSWEIDLLLLDEVIGAFTFWNKGNTIRVLRVLIMWLTGRTDYRLCCYSNFMKSKFKAKGEGRYAKTLCCNLSYTKSRY